MSSPPSFVSTLSWLRFSRSSSSDAQQAATLKTGSLVNIVAYNSKEDNEDVFMQARVDGNLNVNLISMSKAETTGHPVIACEVPAPGPDASGQYHQPSAYVQLRWFVQGGDPKSYEERFYVVEGLGCDALLGTGALQYSNRGDKDGGIRSAGARN